MHENAFDINESCICCSLLEQHPQTMPHTSHIPAHESPLNRFDLMPGFSLDGRPLALMKKPNLASTILGVGVLILNDRRIGVACSHSLSASCSRLLWRLSWALAKQRALSFLELQASDILLSMSVQHLQPSRLILRARKTIQSVHRHTYKNSHAYMMSNDPIRIKELCKRTDILWSADNLWERYRAWRVSCGAPVLFHNKAL
jgi:hypothetical protein